jgi:NAD(P)-dependent dehydrogenase (short-subunit alcohol dehydrogenase family)
MTRTILVAGGSRGLGRAVAEAFSARGGWSVVATARSPFEIPGVRCVAIDSCDEPAMTALIGSLDRLDVVVNNAAIARYRSSLLETPTADLADQLKVNVEGAFIVMREAARRMAAAGEGLIINVGSTFSFESHASMGPYCASKWGFLALSKAFREEMRRKGVRVTTYCPGDMNTGILGDMTRDSRRMNVADLAPMFVHLAELPSYIEVGEMVVNPLPR